VATALLATAVFLLVGAAVDRTLLWQVLGRLRGRTWSEQERTRSS
jgi:hypothetical protein